MKKRFIIPLIIIFSVILSICVSAQPSQADTPLENSESYTDVSVQESANQLYESLMSAFNSANGKNSSTPSQLSYPDAYGGAYINDSGKLVIYVVESKIEDSSDIDSTIEDISNFSPADNVLDSTTADYVLEPCEYSYTDLNNIMDLLNNYKINNQGSEIANNFKKFGLYDSENRVIVYLEEFNEEKIKEFKENVCDSDAIVFAQGFGAIETQSSWSPGQPARNASDQGALTLGYRAKFGSTIGIVTAAHAVKMGEELIWNGDRFAKATIRNLGGSCDAVFCKMINSHDATNTLYGTGNTLSTTISEPGVGTTINKIGFTSGHTSGRVVATDVSADTDTGVFLTNLTEATYDSEGGDSGGIVYSYIGSTNTRLTLGIHLGRYGNNTIYSKANEINDALNISRY